MKKIYSPELIRTVNYYFLLIFLCIFCSFSAKGQDTSVSQASPQVHNSVIPVRGEFDSEGMPLTECPNSDFSLANFTNWSGCFGYWCVPQPLPPAPPVTVRCTGTYTPYNPPCNNPGMPWYNTPTGGHFNIQTPGKDPCIVMGGFQKLEKVFPGDLYSALIGNRQCNNNSAGGYVDQLTYQIVYDPNNSFFIYRCAVVLAHSVDADHNTADKRPRFTFEIRDHATGTDVDTVCGVYDLWPNDGITVWVNTGPPLNFDWKDWSTIGIDLKTLSGITPGQLLDVVFTVHGCAFTAHTGYAYISTVCGSMNIQLAGCEGSGSVTLTGPPGFTEYLWQGPYCPTCPPDPPTYSGNPITLTAAQGAVTGNTFSLTLTALNGCQVQNVMQTIAFTSVTAAFTHGSACVDQGTQFNDQSTATQNGITAWDWDFGDGSPIEHVQNPIHPFTAANTYTVTLTAYSGDGCPNTTSQQLTVDPMPTPSFTAGENSVCLNVPGQVYTTQAGKINYIWIIPPEATVTAGGTSSDNSVTLTWNSAGNWSISVNYTEPVTLCTALTPTPFAITVHPLPVPSFTSGETPVCLNVPGKVYTTEAGKSNYIWTIPPQATVTAGGTTNDNNVILTWNTTGSYSVEVNYTDPVTQCTAASSTPYAVTVNPLPVPSITSGENSVCLNIPGKVYTTEADKLNYIWNIPPQATVTAGGSTNDNSVTVTWNSIGTYSISINYTDPLTYCTAATPTAYAVTVNSLPMPSFTTGVSPVCLNSPNKVYATQAGKLNYIWSIPAQATVTAGGTTSDNSVTLTWNTIGNYSIGVIYTDPVTLCTAVIPAVFAVTVNPLPSPSFTSGESSVCPYIPEKVYTTEAGKLNYIWSIPTQATVTAGGTVNDNSVTLTWTVIGSYSIGVGYTEPATMCIAAGPTFYSVLVNPLPVTTITSGPGPDCNLQQHLYSTPADPACIFTWSVVPGNLGNIGAGQGTDQVTIDWLLTGRATVNVTGINNLTTCVSSSTFPTTIYPSPDPSLTACFDLVTTKNARAFVLKGGIPLLGQYQGSTGIIYDPDTQLFWFEPSLPTVALGIHQISYYYLNMYGCSKSSAPVSINVVPSNLAFTCGVNFTDPRNTDPTTNTYPTESVTAHGRTRCWMLKNFNWGSSIPYSQPQTDNCIVERYCVPATDPNCNSYGGFYQWDELIQYVATAGPDYQGICPPGWHIPSQQDWQDLIDAVTLLSPGDGLAGSFLKDPNLSPGFHALLSGINYMNSIWTFYTGNLTGTMYWTSTPSGISRAIARGMNNANYSVSFYPSSRANAFPVRCIKDY